MECDLDCFEEDQEHIRVRNAGIIDELGHVTFTPPPPFTLSHVLSDKTGTITQNNLRVVRLCTPSRELPVHNSFMSSAGVALDAEASLLLLNMLTNHSALSIATASSDDVPPCSAISLQQSISRQQSTSCQQSISRQSSTSRQPSTTLKSSHLLLPSSSFSELRIITSSEERSTQDHPPLASPASPTDHVQVFCSSQDERVASLFLSHTQALLDAVADFGYRFCSRSRRRAAIDVEIRGMRETLQVLQWFPFTTARKRTSVVVHYRGTLWLLCKVLLVLPTHTQGADATVLPLLAHAPPATDPVLRFVDRCSSQALRTCDFSRVVRRRLLFAGKPLAPEAFAAWQVGVSSPPHRRASWSARVTPPRCQPRRRSSWSRV